jgi:hypothetical protein
VRIPFFFKCLGSLLWLLLASPLLIGALTVSSFSKKGSFLQLKSSDLMMWVFDPLGGGK